MRDIAMLSAIGIGPDERRRVLGVSVALSEAEVHWRAFLEGLVARGLRGVEFIISDDHSGLRAARRAVLGGATWQRYQFHLARNAIHHAPNADIRKRIGRQLKSIWTADNLAKAETAPKLAAWLEENVPEGLAVFTLPEHHRRRLRTRPGLRPFRAETRHWRVSKTPFTLIKRASSRNSNGARSRSGPFPAGTRSCACSVPSSSRSTKNGPPTPIATSSGIPGGLTGSQQSFRTTGFSIPCQTQALLGHVLEKEAWHGPC